jgi:hypothetical protein
LSLAKTQKHGFFAAIDTLSQRRLIHAGGYKRVETPFIKVHNHPTSDNTERPERE